MLGFTAGPAVFAFARTFGTGFLGMPGSSAAAECPSLTNRNMTENDRRLVSKGRALSKPLNLRPAKRIPMTKVASAQAVSTTLLTIHACLPT